MTAVFAHMYNSYRREGMIESRRLKILVMVFVLLMVLPCRSQTLWELANRNKDLIRISTHTTPDIT